MMQNIAWMVLILALIFLIIVIASKHEKKQREKYQAQKEAEAETAPPVARPSLVPCPICNKEISSVATSCPACGHPRSPAKSPAAPEAPGREWKPGIAAVLSFVIPGLGQIYKGKTGAGLIWFVAVVAGYFLLVVPGVILHLICIFSAASGKAAS